MPTTIAKEDLLRALHDLPEHTSIETVQERLALLAKITAGCHQADTGATLPHDDVVRQMERWLK